MRCGHGGDRSLSREAGRLSGEAAVLSVAAVGNGANDCAAVVRRAVPLILQRANICRAIISVLACDRLAGPESLPDRGVRIVFRIAGRRLNRFEERKSELPAWSVGARSETAGPFRRKERGTNV